MEEFKMLVFNDEVRSYSRKAALGFKSLEIEEGVVSCNNCCGVFLEDDKLVCRERENPTVEEKNEMVFLLDRFGVFGNFPNKVEIILCDGFLLVNLIKGAILVRVGDTYRIASKGIPESSIPKLNMKQVSWVNTGTILHNKVNWGKGCNAYPLDFTYSLTLLGGYVDEKGNTKKVTESGGTPHTIIKTNKEEGFLKDFSNGNKDKIRADVLREDKILHSNDWYSQMQERNSSERVKYERPYYDEDYNPDDYDYDEDEVEDIEDDFE